MILVLITFSNSDCSGEPAQMCKLTRAFAIYLSILNIHVFFSIIERVSIKRLTEDLLLIIDACRDT